MRKLLLMNNLQSYRDALVKAAKGFEVIITADKEEIKKHYLDSEVLAGFSPVRDGFLNNTNLKWVQFWGAGVDKFPIAEMKEKGIILTNTSGVHANQISESIFAFMLAYSRGFYKFLPNQRNKVWESNNGLLGEIHGKTLGILGVGAIGAETAKIAKAFGMNVLGLRRSGGEAPYTDKCYKTNEVISLLKDSDYVVNILPLTPETEGFMDKAKFEAMKKTAVYISVGRGKTTNQQDLINALKSGQIAFAGLDVTEPEPLPPTDPLWSLENVIITCHSAGGSDKYDERAMDIFLENVEAYVKTGAPVRNVVNLDLYY